jgi:Holliday junction resolvase RusA-like endonuclease
MTLAANQWLIFEVPVPPTANNLYRNAPGKGRVKTTAYKMWQQYAALTVVLPKPIPHCSGEAHVDIDLPPGLDIDNLKALVDLLQMPEKKHLVWSLGIITNDKLIVDYHVRRVAKNQPCIVRVRPVGEWS